MFTNDKFVISTEDKSGIIDFKFASTPSDQSVLLLDSMVLGLKGIRSQYGKQYLTINIQEV
jgi:uncharacterized protein YsxB (DUF464 family)